LLIPESLKRTGKFGSGENSGQIANWNSPAFKKKLPKADKLRPRGNSSQRRHTQEIAAMLSAATAAVLAATAQKL
jgi:hypothetical protein